MVVPAFVPVDKYEYSPLDDPVSYDRPVIEEEKHFDIPEMPMSYYSGMVNDYQVISLDAERPYLRASGSVMDLEFYTTRDTLSDPEVYRAFIKNCESRFRASKEYTAYKAYLMSMGLDHCQIMGNIESSDGVDIELHHNILNLFDIMVLICEHILNTIGRITSFDLIQLVINEHFANRIPIVFLSTTAHQMYTGDMEGYIPPDMTFGKWWELLAKYRYGITFDIANKINTYINRYQNNIPTSIQIIPQEQILNFAYFNEYGIPMTKQNIEPYKIVPNTNCFNTQW